MLTIRRLPWPPYGMELWNLQTGGWNDQNWALTHHGWMAEIERPVGE